ncbi:MAG TPA: hypothetical protein VD794_01545 [Flavisolibacter sp.]|nr:hypothetical protein [Flavisolibacter sp.]
MKLPIFKLSEKGFKITELGGGNQTKSLSFEDQKGREWVLRTIDKDVEKALPASLRGTLAQRVVQDMVSAAHPYAPPTIPPFAKALGLVVPEPVIYYVPDDPSFGEYKSIFANTVCLLERKEPTPDDSDTKNTDNMFEDVLQKNDHLVLQHELLKARLLDMLIADWDRHADQWRWGTKEVNGIDHYYGIPRDRDQAYFFSNGLLVKLARKVSAKHFVGYRNDLDKLVNLNYKSWKFDKLFLNSLDAKVWDSTIRFVQAQLTDELIRQAFLQLPPEIYPISGPELERKFMARREDLLEKGMKYYRYLSKIVTVNGTDQEELFKISSDINGLKVTVFAWKDGKLGHTMYERVFTRKETWKIQFQGFDGNDQFIVDENANSKIRLLFKGGKGKDSYNIKGKIKNTIDDDKMDDNELISLSCTRNRIE